MEASQVETGARDQLRARAGAPDFLIHREGDQVGVAVQDVEPGPARAVHMDSGRRVDLEVRERVPLGHKVALSDLEAGADVIEYGARIGLTRRPIERGELVHVHNIRSARWETSE